MEIEGPEADAEVARFASTVTGIRGRLLIFRALVQDVPRWITLAPHLGWQGLSDRLVTCDVAASHLGLLQDPHVHGWRRPSARRWPRTRRRARSWSQARQLRAGFGSLGRRPAARADRRGASGLGGEQIQGSFDLVGVDPEIVAARQTDHEAELLLIAIGEILVDRRKPAGRLQDQQPAPGSITKIPCMRPLPSTPTTIWRPRRP